MLYCCSRAHFCCNRWSLPSMKEDMRWFPSHQYSRGWKRMRSGLMQTVNARRINEDWHIAFTHASPVILTAESIEASPINFLNKTLAALCTNLSAGASPCHDALTGIMNRNGLEYRADQLLRAYNPKHNTALFVIELGDFKQINDRLDTRPGTRCCNRWRGAAGCISGV